MSQEIDEDVLEWEDWKPEEESFLSHMVKNNMIFINAKVILI
jgi:hypothetical protein